ncbi:hypothetical protein LTR84_000610 [Exophiala bonariae]|uniref:Uncharacterized protein n=1 Tax=Exophiala bonariae TaxID=1690606 RepID=A0AAV9NR15_9EURO|nr:hypothetical protein LTR84_000610 [Exophiala bonariae]
MAAQHSEDTSRMVQGRRLYGLSLRAMERSLLNKKQQNWSKILVASGLLASYELLLNAGEISILVAGGPESFVEGHAHKLFVDYRLHLIYPYIQNHKRCPLSTLEWKTIPWSNHPKGPKDKLIDILIEIPGILEDMGALETLSTQPEKRHFLGQGLEERGFVEAYAPALEQFGIHQDEFISFVRATNRAVRASKWLSAIQLAAAGAPFVPNHIALGASVAVQVIASVMAKAETRWKTNSFLDRVNEEYFRPRGLYCLLMAYTPIKLGANAHFDVGEAIPREQPLPSTSLLLKEQTGTVEGEESLPSNVAPLVYPTKFIAVQEDPKSTKSRNTVERVTEYLDDRAQARYAKESKGDVLSQPSPPSFKHWLLDPNHPATNGGLLGLISGGYLTPNADKAKQRMQSSLDAQTQAIQKQQEAMMNSLHQQLTLMNLPPEQERAYIQQYKDAFQLQEQQLAQQTKLLNSGAGHGRRIWTLSYLMIVEIPSDEQIATACESLKASDGRQFGPELTMQAVEIG